MPLSDPTLEQLGWKPVFSEQVSAEEARSVLPVRVLSVHRGMVTVSGGEGEESISSRMPERGDAENRPTVGDWLLIDPDTRGIVRILTRTSLFKRPTPHDDRRIQLIAANVDTLFIVNSLNQDFNLLRSLYAIEKIIFRSWTAFFLSSRLCSSVHGPKKKGHYS